MAVMADQKDCSNDSASRSANTNPDRLTETASLAHNLSTAKSARLFALVNLSLADSVIAFQDAKYTYNFWRPVTAIREADADINPETIANPNWLPEVTNTAPDPSYPGRPRGNQRSRGGSPAFLFWQGPLRFQRHIGSDARRRTFLYQLRGRVGRSNSQPHFSGQHFRSDLTAGHRLGRDVADFVFDHFLTRVRGSEDFQNR